MLTQFRLDALAVLGRVSRDGAVALPLIEESFRRRLHREAAAYRYRKARSLVGSGARAVRQRMGVLSELPPDSLYCALTRAFQSMWDRSLSGVAPYPFESTLHFNDLMLQKYDNGEVGITPHRDHIEYRNLICLFVIAGRGRFDVCDSRAGDGARRVEHRPGDVILTSAPGLMGRDERPFHCLSDITEPRYVFGLRQDRRIGDS